MTMKRTTKWILLALIAGVALPAAASEKVDNSAAITQRIQHELEAVKEREPQSIDPISGEPIVEGQGYEYMGYFIGTCCAESTKQVKAKPLQTIYKIRSNGEEPRLADGFTKQDRSPISGKPVKDGVFAVKNNLLVKFHSAEEAAQYKKNPESVISTMMEQKQAPVVLAFSQQFCPISGTPITPGLGTTLNGKFVAVCCGACIPAIEEKPEETLQSLADAGVVLPDGE